MEIPETPAMASERGDSGPDERITGAAIQQIIEFAVQPQKIFKTVMRYRQCSCYGRNFTSLSVAGVERCAVDHHPFQGFPDLQDMNHAGPAHGRYDQAFTRQYREHILLRQAEYRLSYRRAAKTGHRDQLPF